MDHGEAVDLAHRSQVAQMLADVAESEPLEPLFVRRIGGPRAAALIEVAARYTQHWYPADAIRRHRTEVACLAAMLAPVKPTRNDVDGWRPVGAAIYREMPDRILIYHVGASLLYRRRGVGRELLQRLVGRLAGGQRKLTTIVPERNLAAQMFFAACGFRAIDVYRSFFGADEDGFVMVRRRWR